MCASNFRKTTRMWRSLGEHDFSSSSRACPLSHSSLVASFSLRHCLVHPCIGRPTLSPPPSFDPPLPLFVIDWYNCIVRRLIAICACTLLIVLTCWIPKGTLDSAAASAFGHYSFRASQWSRAHTWNVLAWLTISRVY